MGKFPTTPCVSAVTVYLADRVVCFLAHNITREAEGCKTFSTISKVNQSFFVIKNVDI